MRSLLFFALLSCSKPSSPPVAPPPAPRGNAVSGLLGAECRGASVDAAKWEGKWLGTRPFDPTDAFAHRGPTTVQVKVVDATKLELAEGVGAAGYQLELELDAVSALALGTKTTRSTHTALQLGGGGTTELTITKDVTLAACLDQAGQLHLARMLGSEGVGIRSQRERDVVVLRRPPPVPPAPPPPGGFEVLAEGQQPATLALAPDDVVWSTNDGAPVSSTIRAVPRNGGAIRELASGLEFVHSMTVHEGYVYAAAHSRIVRVALSGGPVEDVVTNMSVDQLAIAAGLVVWSSFDDTVSTRSLAGGEPRPLWKAKDGIQVAGLVVDGAFAYVATRPLAYEQRGALIKVPLGGGAPQTTLANQTLCGGLLAAGDAIWFSSCEGNLVRAGKRGGTRIMARDQNVGDGLARSGSTLVFSADGAVRALASDGKVRSVLEGDFLPRALAIDPKEPTVVYVLDQGRALEAPQGRVGKFSLGKR